MAKNEGSTDARGVYVIRSRLNGWDIHLDTVNPKLLELQAAKEMLADIYGIQIWEVDDLIQQCIVDFRLTGIEFKLYAESRSCLS